MPVSPLRETTSEGNHGEFLEEQFRVAVLSIVADVESPTGGRGDDCGYINFGTSLVFWHSRMLASHHVLLSPGAVSR